MQQISTFLYCINENNKNNSIINLYTQHCSDTKYPEIYLTEYNQLSIGEKEKFENDYNIS